MKNQKMQDQDLEDVSITKKVSSGRVLLLTFPSPFVKKYALAIQEHVRNQSKLKVDAIVCVVTDLLCNVKKWHACFDCKDKIHMFADWGGQFAIQTGLGKIGEKYGLGFVLRPSMILLNDGVVESIETPSQKDFLSQSMNKMSLKEEAKQ
jgi:peroxiredoxin